MPSKKQSDQSNEASDQPVNPSVFDFLYYDATRISSFLAQFESSGHVTQVTQNEQANRASKDTQTSEVGSSVKVASGKLVDSAEMSKTYAQQLTKTYDPRWANALAFLEYIEQKSLLVRDIFQARIGQITMITGDLSLFDLSILQKMWALPGFKKLALAGATAPEQVPSLNRQERRKAGAQTKASGKFPSEAELAVELMSVLPHAIQAAVSMETASAWCSLREDSITISPSDLFMKHGLTISGEWTMLGVLDAMPDEDIDLGNGISFEGAKQLVAGYKLGMLSGLVASPMVAPTRQMLGRPSLAHGMTPLLIFRQVSGAD